MPIPLPAEQRFAVPSDVLVNIVDGQSVLLNLKSERYFGLDEVGTRMWAALTTAESVQAACEALLAEYDVEPDRLRKDIEELAARLLAHGLLEVRGQ